MTDPFQKHKIEHLSPSSINTYVDQPAFWAMKYLHGFREDGNAAMWRGSAVEGGLDHFLLKGRDEDGCQIACNDLFELEAQGEITDSIEKEYGALPSFLSQAIQGCQAYQLREPNVRQIKVEVWLDGIEVPIMGYIDYEWDDFGIDLKTTRRIPREISGRHARQISLYREARKKPYKLLYVSEKKFEMRELAPSEFDHHFKALGLYAHSIRRALSVSDDPTEVARLFPPNMEHFFWRSEESQTKAKEIWEDAD